MEPDPKKMKIEENIFCKHFVIRKKRLCKMTVAKGKEYCGEHDISKETVDGVPGQNRIPCPLDSKHTIYRRNLRKHLKICNARPKDLPDFIEPNINAGSDSEEDESTSNENKNIKLSEVDEETMNKLIEKIEFLYNKFVEGNIQEFIEQHKILETEISNKEYGHETRKHLVQTSSILGCLHNEQMLLDDTSFIEFGAGKGQVSYWLAKSIEKFNNSKVILLDRASHRHKKDNKIEDREIVQRIRVDISDFKMENLDLIKTTKRVIAVGKHLCGAATDLTLRCILNGRKIGNENEKSLITEGFLIALCCHHRCEWRSFVGKKFFKENDLNHKDFNYMRKMAGWAICGNGFSRERRKELEANSVETVNITKSNISREKKEEIGKMCKRIFDYSRVQFMIENNFNCNLKYYVKQDITLENVCLLGKLKM